MTTTDIGILLIVLCILLWAIMAALHRHTVQLEALKVQMESLLKALQSQPDSSLRNGHPSGPRDNIERLTAHSPDKMGRTAQK
ncbi:MAG: hypothetical protein ACRESR_01555 [Gammaproteobacteria bacterium]